MRTAKGYTLLELVIGMTLVSMLMLALAVGIGVGSRAWQRGEVRLRQTHVEAERTSFVLEQIASMVPYQVQSNDPVLPGQWPIVEANPFRFRFISTQGSRYRDRSGLLLVEYAVVRSPAGMVDVALDETPVVDDAVLLHLLIDRVELDPDTQKRRVVFRHSAIRPNAFRLLAGLRAARFEYLDPGTKPGAPPEWVEEFDSRPADPFPAAVRLRWLPPGQTAVEAQVFPLRAQGPPPELNQQ